MIDIVFGESAGGSLKLAQSYGKGKYAGGCVGVILSHSDGSEPTQEEIQAAQKEAEQKEQEAWEAATPLGGSPADVFSFSLGLSMGDISEGALCPQRQEVLEQLFGVFPQGQEAVSEMLQRAREDFKTVCSRMAKGESVRIWYSSQPDEMCGLFWFLAQLEPMALFQKQIYEQVHLVALPSWEVDSHGNMVRKNSWGDIAPGEWHPYLSLEKQAPSAFCTGCAAHWRNLQEENAPLRAVLNGQLVSAPETLYDTFILREIDAEQEEFQEAKVIGRVLGKYQLGIGDMWVAARIQQMVEAGALQVVAPPAPDAPVYRRILRKCK